MARYAVKARPARRVELRKNPGVEHYFYVFDTFHNKRVDYDNYPDRSNAEEMAEMLNTGFSPATVEAMKKEENETNQVHS